MRIISKDAWLILIGLVICALLLLWLAFGTGSAGAFNDHACGKGDAGDQNPHCISPTPTVKPTATPTITEAPTLYPCEHGDVSWDEEATPCPSPVMPSPTPVSSPSAMPTPTATPSASTSVGSSVGQSNGAPAPVVCTNPFAAPVLTSITAGESGELTVNWSEADTSINHYSIVYGLVDFSMNMGVDNISNTSSSYTIGDLPIGAFINAQVWAWKDGCPEKSRIVDPQVKKYLW